MDVLVVMLVFCNGFGCIVLSWIFVVLWDSDGSLGVPSNLVLEWVGVLVPCDFSR